MVQSLALTGKRITKASDCQRQANITNCNLHT